MSSDPSTAGLVLAPDWLAHRYEPTQDAIHLVKADRALRRAVPFQTDEHLPGAAEPLIVPRAQVMAAMPQPAPIHFVFHSAYCCSTLLANALDVTGVATSAKEPTLLNDLVGWRLRGGEPAKIGAMLDQALALLARPFEAGEAVVVKPSNIANGLIEPILKLRPEARAILLHAPLDVYLRSIAGKGLWGRLWVRDLLAKQLRENFIDLPFDVEDYLKQSDLQVAAVGWLAQHKLFARIAAQWPERVRTLDSEVLTARPAATLAAVAKLFGLDLDDAAIARIVATTFTRDAKTGAAFAPGARAADQASRASAHADELEKVAGWARTVADGAGIAMDLPSALM